MGRLLENAGLKVASVLVAALLWFIVAGEKTSEVGLTVPVELRNLPENLEIVGDAVNEVEVRLRATPAIVRQLDHGDISLRLDLKGFEEGQHFFHLTEEAVRRPFGVTVVRLSPASLTLDIERTLSRELPIEARVVGTPAAGYEVVEVLCQPKDVRVSGPRSRVKALTSVFTEGVLIDGAQTQVAQSVTIGIGDPLVRIEGSPRVQVTVGIRERQEMREIEGLGVEVRGGRARVRPSRVTVVVAGPRSALSRLTREAVRPYVDLPAAAGLAVARVAVELAPGSTGVRVEQVKPSVVGVVGSARHP